MPFEDHSIVSIDVLSSVTTVLYCNPQEGNGLPALSYVSICYLNTYEAYGKYGWVLFWPNHFSPIIKTKAHQVVYVVSMQSYMLPRHLDSMNSRVPVCNKASCKDLPVIPGITLIVTSTVCILLFLYHGILAISKLIVWYLLSIIGQLPFCFFWQMSCIVILGVMLSHSPTACYLVCAYCLKHSSAITMSWWHPVGVCAQTHFTAAVTRELLIDMVVVLSTVC